jgi:hypothetical protein
MVTSSIPLWNASGLERLIAWRKVPVRRDSQDKHAARYNFHENQAPISFIEGDSGSFSFLGEYQNPVPIPQFRFTGEPLSSCAAEGARPQGFAR